MRNGKKTIIIILSLLLAASIGYYYFVATLSLTQMVGKSLLSFFFDVSRAACKSKPLTKPI